ncbi:MAG TPA: PDZ domain-containing protein [Terriglobales bacterium]|nr:PDZ domain-containing protein [Terriglobales bacterium]
MHLSQWVFAGVVCLSSLVLAQTSSAPMRLSVDATEVQRRILHVRLTMPAVSAKTTLVYPKWIPGEHAPTGPINDLMGLHFSARGATQLWQRDDVDMFAFRLQNPANAVLEAKFDITGPSTEDEFLLGNSVTRKQMVLNWNQVVLYPLGMTADEVKVQARLTLPAGWKFASALPVETRSADTIVFKPVSLTTLVDSPVLAGAHFREFDVTPAGEDRRHFLDVTGETDAAIDLPDDLVASYRRLVEETGALFRSRHYRSYHFLVSMHGTFEDGLEHPESSDNRLPEAGLIDPEWRRIYAYLLAHEMVHSWNGKFRRPAGLATSDYQQPMKGDLLWVYEGLTNYLGQVLAVRSGLWTAERYRDKVADMAAFLDNRPGRTWRSLQDTTISAPIAYGPSPQWGALRRNGDTPDFYSEGSLLWLEVDTIIRSRSGGTKSVDDFCRDFYGGPSGPPRVIAYSFDDLVSGLSRVVAFDWRGFFDERLNSLSPRAPLGGVQASGWRLAYSGSQTPLSAALESKMARLDMRYSMGALLETSGLVADVIPGTPADRAGLTPGAKIVAVNSHVFSGQELRNALRAAEDSSEPIELRVMDGADVVELRMDYHAGERYPHLEREDSSPDVLSSILAPLGKAK